MSFLAEIKSRNASLKPVQTRITHADGKVFLETFGKVVVEEGECNSGDFFVVDTRPDDTLHRVIEGIYIGSQDAACNIEELRKNNIRNILNVAAHAAPFKFENIHYKCLPLLDIPEFQITTHFEEAILYIKDNITRNPVLVHCNAGISRSTTIIVAFLMQEKAMTLDCALELVRKARPVAKPNPGFMKQLREFEKGLETSIKNI